MGLPDVSSVVKGIFTKAANPVDLFANKTTGSGLISTTAPEHPPQHRESSNPDIPDAKIIPYSLPCATPPVSEHTPSIYALHRAGPYAERAPPQHELEPADVLSTSHHNTLRMLPPLEPLSASSYRLCCEEHPESLLQNPIALQKKYLKLKDDPSLKKTKSELHKAVKAGEQPALEMLLDLFDWLDGLEPQPTMEVFPLHEEPQNTEGRIADPLAQDNQVAGKRAKNTATSPKHRRSCTSNYPPVTTRECSGAGASLNPHKRGTPQPSLYTRPTPLHLPLHAPDEGVLTCLEGYSNKDPMESKIQVPAIGMRLATDSFGGTPVQDFKYKRAPLPTPKARPAVELKVAAKERDVLLERSQDEMPATLDFQDGTHGEDETFFSVKKKSRRSRHKPRPPLYMDYDPLNLLNLLIAGMGSWLNQAILLTNHYLLLSHSIMQALVSSGGLSTSHIPPFTRNRF